MAKDVPVIERPPFYITSSLRESVAIAVNGLLAGIAVWGISVLLDRFVITPIFCSNASQAAACDGSGLIAFNIATVLVAVATIFSLARIGVFRPLIVALATAITLWALPSYIAGVSTAAPLFEQIVWLATLYALMFLVFSWLLRLRSFAISLVLTLAVVVLFRYLLMQ